MIVLEPVHSGLIVPVVLFPCESDRELSAVSSSVTDIV